jgi:hypothetical protein
MDLFGRWRRRDRATEDAIDVEKALAVIGARQRFLEALTSHLVMELPPKKRDHLLRKLQQVVGEFMIFPPPEYVSSDTQQDFQDELRRAMQILIEKSTRPTPTS